MNRILVVCRANVVRSPIAAAALSRAVGDECEIDSAGLAAIEGLPVPAEALQQLRRYVLDMSKHQSRSLTDADLRRSDVILGMTERHRASLQAMLPTATARTFTFAEFVRLLESLPALAEFDRDFPKLVEAAHHQRPRLAAPLLPEDVADPLGGSAARMRECIDHVVDLAHRLALRLA